MPAGTRQPQAGSPPCRAPASQDRHASCTHPHGLPLTRSAARDLDKVAQQGVHDGLGGVRHEHAAAEGRVPRHVRHRGAVVQVEVGHQHGVHLAQVHLVEEGQAGQAVEAGVHAAVQHHALAGVAHDDAGAPHLLARTQRQDLRRGVGSGRQAGSRKHLDRPQGATTCLPTAEAPHSSGGAGGGGGGRRRQRRRRRWRCSPSGRRARLSRLPAPYAPGRHRPRPRPPASTARKRAGRPFRRVCRPGGG